MTMQDIGKELIQQVERLVQKHDSLEELKKMVLTDLPKLEDGLTEYMQGAIVYKKICCHKKACSTCGGTRNEHGPYPHLQWRDEETGKLKTRYISRKNFPFFEAQLALSKKIDRRKRLLFKIQDRQFRIFKTLSFCLGRVNGKEVNQDVQAS